MRTINKTNYANKVLELGYYRLCFDEKALPASTTTPPWHRQFGSKASGAEPKPSSAFSHHLTLVLHNQTQTTPAAGDTLICRNEIWELWRDEQDGFVFTNPMQRLRRWIHIDQAFTHGSIYGDFSSPAPTCYPLPQDLEIVFFINWLGGNADLLLHASGIALDGKGYAFAGPSGVGKSTLAATLASDPSVTVLGEDQLLLRYIDGEFWIFGTPWHSSSAMCAPTGVPLKRLYFLHKDGTQRLAPVAPLESVTRLLQTAFIPYYRPDLVEKQLHTLERLSSSVEMTQLSYRLGADLLNIIGINRTEP